MPMWRCPHCGTPQAETARCWVCRRSSTACGTCRHFRRSVAANVGYCGLDRRRLPLVGDEIRACWEAGALPLADDLPRTPAFIPTPGLAPLADAAAAVRRDFVEVGTAVAVIDTEAPPTADPPPDVIEPPFGSEPRWSLWAELEG